MKRPVWALAAAAATSLALAQAPTTETPGASSPLASLPIQRHTLENGLRVVLSPDRTVPTVALAVYYDVGSRNEVRGRSGFAHLFEHMMFQGSANVGKGEHFQLVMNRGGSLNGTTNHDRTNYFETLPSNELALGLWLEADRMRSLAVTAENFENQRQVVKEERRQSYDNQPYALSHLRINELAYGDYWPYAHSTIGDMQDLDAAPLEAVQQFFDQYYRPNNAVLSISGDFDPAEALALAQRFFGEIHRGEVPAYQPPELAPQTAERRESMTDPHAELPAFHVAWHIPTNRADDHYALELLGLVLGDGQSSRLYQKLVKEREICQQIYIGTDDRRGPDLFSAFGILASGHQPAEAQTVIFDELRSVADRGITERELQKAHNRVRSYFVFGLQSNMSRARQLAEYEMYYGDAALVRSELERYLAVTREDVQRVARQYFDATNRTVLDVMPAAAAEEGAGGGEGAYFAPGAPGFHAPGFRTEVTR
ncbi:MAG: insulinase family protein [Sandaracinus sp.]|nr:insulinase family protein [Sandaracinus sp.]MCB9633770.1 insulinase family protein [Sandaracinus sp.]